MATTKLWPVYDSLRRVLDYANNPEKTEYSSLRDVIHYAENGEKTMLTGEETVYLTTAVNCDFWGDTPLEELWMKQRLLPIPENMEMFLAMLRARWTDVEGYCRYIDLPHDKVLSIRRKLTGKA